MSRYTVPTTRMIAAQRIPHLLGYVECGQVVDCEPVAVGVVAVHLPEIGVVFTTSSKFFKEA